MAKKTTRKKPTRRTSSRKSSRKKPATIGSLIRKISKERKTDIIGILLIIFGIIAMIGFWGKPDGKLTGWMVLVLGQIAGIGSVIFPIILLLIGFWLVFRNEKRFPMLSIERLIGIISLYLNILTWLHWFDGGGWDLAAAGGGGGYLGAVFERLLVVALGYWGAFVVLLAWSLVSLAFTFDVSIPDLFRNLSANASKTGKFITKQTKQVTGRKRASSIPKTKEAKVSFPDNGEQPEGFTPIAKGKARKHSRVTKTESPVPQIEPIEITSDALPNGVTIERIYHLPAPGRSSGHQGAGAGIHRRPERSRADRREKRSGYRTGRLPYRVGHLHRRCHDRQPARHHQRAAEKMIPGNHQRPVTEHAS